MKRACPIVTVRFSVSSVDWLIEFHGLLSRLLTHFENMRTDVTLIANSATDFTYWDIGQSIDRYQECDRCGANGVAASISRTNGLTESQNTLTAEKWTFMPAMMQKLLVSRSRLV